MRRAGNTLLKLQGELRHRPANGQHNARRTRRFTDRGGGLSIEVPDRASGQGDLEQVWHTEEPQRPFALSALSALRRQAAFELVDDFGEPHRVGERGRDRRHEKPRTRSVSLPLSARGEEPTPRGEPAEPGARPRVASPRTERAAAPQTAASEQERFDPEELKQDLATLGAPVPDGARNVRAPDRPRAQPAAGDGGDEQSAPATDAPLPHSVFDAMREGRGADKLAEVRGEGAHRGGHAVFDRMRLGQAQTFDAGRFEIERRFDEFDRRWDRELRAGPAPAPAREDEPGEEAGDPLDDLALREDLENLRAQVQPSTTPGPEANGAAPGTPSTPAAGTSESAPQDSEQAPEASGSPNIGSESTTGNKEQAHDEERPS